MYWQQTRSALFGALLVAIGVLVGTAVTLVQNGGTTSVADFNTTLLHASSASSGEQFALATGAIDDDAEGVFVLDYSTGELKCAVMNQRTGKFAALFSTNVTNELGAAKNPKYEMVTGLVNFRRGGTPTRPGMSVVYVLDASTGKLVAYGIPWKREMATSGRTQVGSLRALDGMQVRGP